MKRTFTRQDWTFATGVPYLSGVAPVSGSEGAFGRLLGWLSADALAPIVDPRLPAVLGVRWGDYGAQPSTAPLLEHAMVTGAYNGGAFYPVGGPSRFAAALRPVIEATDGEMQLGADLRQIGIVDGRVGSVKFGNRSAHLLTLLLFVTASSVEAAQPLVTDDAAVVAPKTCQLEVWTRSAHAGRAYGAQPACNFTGNLELTFGAARANPDGGEASNIVQLQAKTVLFALDDREWSFGMVVGGGRDTGAPHGSSAFQLYYAKALASWYPRSDLEIDLNLGAANAYGSGTFVLAGAAIQYTVISNVQLLAEAFRDEPGSAKYQVGARFIIVPDRFEAYASYGNRLNGASDQWSAIIGIRVQTAAFLP